MVATASDRLPTLQVVTRRLRVEWAPGRKVDALLDVAGPGHPAILLASGAGAGQRHPFMAGMRRRLYGGGLTVMTFDYPYADEGRRAPDRMLVLLACHEAARDRLAEYSAKLVLAGKSMGGRMATHVAAEGTTPAGVVVYGYPLQPPGAREPRDTSHLARIEAPVLLISGERDRMGPAPLLEQIASVEGMRLERVPLADHGFRVPRSSGLEPDQVLDDLASRTLSWMEAF